MQVGERRSQEERRDATRGQLLTAARTLFADKGFAGTGTPEIVAAAGVTRGALYHHFADKTALFAAVVEAEHAAVAAAIAAHGAPAGSDPLAALLAGNTTFFMAMRDPGRRRIMLIEAPAVLGREAVESMDREHGLATLVCGLEEAMAAGAIRDVPVLPLAQLLGAMYDRAALAPPAQFKQYQAAMTALLEGLRP